EVDVQRRRVVITGIGPITPIGITTRGLRDGLRAERSAVGAVTRFDTSPWRTHIAAQVDAFEAGDHLEAKRAKRLDRFGQFSVVAAQLALEDSEIDLAHEDRERIGSMMGSALGGIGFAEAQLINFLRDGVRAVDPSVALKERERAVARGAHVYAEVVGYGTTNDAHHMTAPRPDGRQAARAMKLALDDADVRPHEIGYVNAHGSSTPLNDTTETLALKQ